MKLSKIFSYLLVALPYMANAQVDSTMTSDLFDLPLEQTMNLQITTATKTAGKSDAAPAVIEIITAEQIKVRGYQHLAHILNDIPNNHEDRSNWGIGEPTNQNVGFGFRFDTGQNMLILFNGQRLNAFLPGNRFGGEEYLLPNIERIEIIRGPGSALYGTGAFTCVVNIITKKIAKDENDEINISADYIPTSRGAMVNGAATVGVGENGSLSTAFHYLTEEGQSLNVQNSLFGDAVLKDGVNHAINAEVFFSSQNFNLFSKITNQSRNTFTGFNGVNPSSAEELTLKMYAYSIGTDKTFKLGKKNELKLSAGWHQDNWTEVAMIPQFKISNDGSELITDDKGMPVLDTLTLFRNGRYINSSFFYDGQGADTRSIDAEIQFTSNFRAANNLVIGVYVSDDKILRAERPTELNLDPHMFIPFSALTDEKNNWLIDLDASRKTIAGFAQIDYNITDKLMVVTGARLDGYSGTGALTRQKYVELNPRASVVYSVDDASTIKALYGTATRIPNGFETLSTVSILGSPENRPERIRTYQVQWIKNWTRNLRTEFGAFRSTISNRIETNADISDVLRAQGFVGQFVNSSAPRSQKNNGVDLKAIARIKNSTFSINATQYFGSDDGHGHNIGYIPNTMANIDHTLILNDFSLSTGLNYRAAFTKALSDSRPVVKDYLIFRTSANYQPSRSPIGYRLQARNLFNAKYLYPSSSVDFTNHFPARGIEVSIGVTYTP